MHENVYVCDLIFNMWLSYHIHVAFEKYTLKQTKIWNSFFVSKQISRLSETPHCYWCQFKAIPALYIKGKILLQMSLCIDKKDLLWKSWLVIQA